MQKVQHKDLTFVNPYMGLVGTVGTIMGAQGELSPSEHESLSSLINEFEGTVVELGCGSGMHLNNLATLSKNKLHVGFELRFKRAYSAGRKAELAGHSNVRIIRLDGRSIFEIFPLNSIDGLYINFPDPWDRRRWEKHRMLTEKNVSQIIPLLKKGGFIHYRTDHKDAFERGVEALTSHGLLVPVLLERGRVGDPSPPHVPSEFGNLFKSKGIPISYITVQKTLTL